MHVTFTSCLRLTLLRLIEDQQGSILPIIGAIVMLATAGAAVAVDIGRAYAYRAQLSIAADAAALAGAVNLPDVDAARTAVYRYAAINMPGFENLVRSEDIEFGHWDPETRRLVSSEDVPSALRVTTRLSEENGNAIRTLFASVFGNDTLEVAASAVAGKRSSMCIQSLEPDAADGLGIDIAANIEALNCTVQVNSRHDYAFRIWLGSKIVADGLCVTGGAYLSGWATISPEPTLGCPPQPDPLIDLKAPEVGGCDHHDKVLMAHHGNLEPGVYCGGLKVMGDSDLTLAAGVYVIKDGPLGVFDTSKLRGEGITFFLTGEDGLIRLDDNSTLTLTAPTDGDMAGILVFQDRDFGGHHLWDSKAPTELHGTIYLPEGQLLSQSSSSITPIASCNVLIAKRLHFKFKSGVSIDLDQAKCRQYLPSAVLGAPALLD
ncbi:MAG: TadG family pilus assembly protein [Pseudomonadota bacterium]